MIEQTGFVFHDYPELDSTNEEAKRLLSQGAIQRPTIIRAHTQTAGKGTQGRQWISPPGAGLYFSVVHPFLGEEQSPQSISPEAPLTPLFTLAAGVACAETLQELTGLTIHLKPINDLYVDGCKLGGILVENILSENRCKALITGIGINIYRHEQVDAGCAEDHRGNQPISLQACIAPHLFKQWHGDAIMQELSLAIAHNVNHCYQQLILNEEQTILARYLQFKLPGMALPNDLRLQCLNALDP